MTQVDISAPTRDDRESLPTLLVMHNVSVAGNRTTIRLEPIIWDALQDVADAQGISVHSLVTEIDRRRITKNLSAEIRAYVVADLLARVG